MSVDPRLGRWAPSPVVVKHLVASVCTRLTRCGAGKLRRWAWASAFSEIKRRSIRCDLILARGGPSDDGGAQGSAGAGEGHDGGARRVVVPARGRGDPEARVTIGGAPRGM